MPSRIAFILIPTLGIALLAGDPIIASGGQDAPSRENRGDDERANRGTAQNRGDRQVAPSRIVARLMQSDANGDGRISRAEIGEGRFAEQFDQADANGDGYIVEKEIITFLGTRDRGSGQPEGPRGGRSRAPGGEETEAVDPKQAFDKGMAESGRALRSLRRTPFDASSFDNDLSAVVAMQQGLLDARTHVGAVPMSVAAKERFGTDRRAYVRSFQAHMAKSLVTSFQLELAILDGDASVAKKLITKIIEDRNEGHDIF